MPSVNKRYYTIPIPIGKTKILAKLKQKEDSLRKNPERKIDLIREKSHNQRSTNKKNKIGANKSNIKATLTKKL